MRHCSTTHQSCCYFLQQCSNTILGGLPTEDSEGAQVGGGSGIRTHGTREGSTVFKTVAFDRSAIAPFEKDLFFVA